MKTHIKNLRRFLLFLAFSFSVSQILLAQTGPVYLLSYPPEPGAPSHFENSGYDIDLTPRDSFESCVLTFSATGPITYYINGYQNPSVMNGGKMHGSVWVDTLSTYFPSAGNTAPATLTCNYKITYSSPLNPLYPTHGGPLATNVSQTTGNQWSCQGSPSHPCYAGHTVPSQHTLVTETGTVQFNFVAMAAPPKCNGKVYDPKKNQCLECPKGKEVLLPANTATYEAVCTCCNTPGNKLLKKIHHIASDKQKEPGIYTKEFKKIAEDKYDLDLTNDDWNLMEISNEFHCSKHPKEYHDMVLEGMKKADTEAAKLKDKKKQQDKFKEVFAKEVKAKLKANLSMLCSEK